MNGVKPTGSESERDFLIEVISWGEDIDTGRWGYDRAAEMLDGYVAARVAAVEAERDRLRETVDLLVGWQTDAGAALAQVADRLDDHSYSELACVLSDEAVDQYGERYVAQRDKARARLVALLEAISMLGKGEVAAYGRAAARGDS